MSRTRSFTRGVHVSGLGLDGYRIIDGAPLERIEAVPQYTAHFTVDAGSTDPQDVALLTEGTYVRELVNHIALTGGTVAVSLIDPKGVAADIDLNQTLALNAAAASATGAFLTPLSSDRIIRATVTDGTASETAVMSLTLGVLRPDRT